MKTLTIHLPDSAYATASTEAQRLKMDVTAMCSLLLTEKLTTADPHTPSKVNSAPSLAPPPRESIRPSETAQSKLDVAANFLGYPRTSIDLAQGFVDAALTYPNTKAFKNNRGIGIDDNFVFIEYLRFRGTPGIMASFCPPPEELHDATGLLVLKPGRGKYTRVDITNRDALNAAIELIRQAWEWRFGR
jgi:hypothetical protein